MSSRVIAESKNGDVSPEHYYLSEDRGRAIRKIVTRRGRTVNSEVSIWEGAPKRISAAELYDMSWLRAKDPPKLINRRRKVIRIADMFSGCGMMTLGAIEACRALGFRGTPILAMDSNEHAASVYQSNFPSAAVTTDPIEHLIDRDFGSAPSRSERAFCREIGDIDILLGGPPCQGHSDLNNHTRRADPKNALLLKMTRAVELFQPNHVVIENVRGIQHDRSNVVQDAFSQLTSLGYQVDTGLLKAEQLGVAQQRQRFFMVASRSQPMVSLASIASTYNSAPRTFAWAAGDLLGAQEGTIFDGPSRSSPENKRRMKYLFERDIYDLPNSQRPACHRYNSHSYKSVYGRMDWSKPSQTITTGYGSMGQGRFVHPKRQRTITPHEASRLQFIPDFFDFGNHGRGAIAGMIGNAVPPKLTYLIALEALR